MNNDQSARRPKVKPCPIVCRTSDLDYDFGAPLLPDHRTLCDRWRAIEIEREGGLRAGIFRRLGMM